jgi:hypothetical protein
VHQRDEIKTALDSRNENPASDCRRNLVDRVGEYRQLERKGVLAADVES